MKVERMKKRIGRVDQIHRLMLTISFLLLSSRLQQQLYRRSYQCLCR